jgi:hypothetical protein
MEDISTKIQRKVEEDAIGIESRASKDLIIYDLKNYEYDAFVKLIKSDSPLQKGWEMFNILMDNYKKSKQINQIAEYNEELKEKNAKLEARIAELEAKEVPKEKKKFIGGE